MRTVDLLPCDALNVDDPLLSIHLYNLSFPPLQQQHSMWKMFSMRL